MKIHQSNKYQIGLFMNMSKYIKETNIKEECFQMYQQSNKYHKCMHAYIDVKIYQRNKITYMNVFKCIKRSKLYYNTFFSPLCNQLQLLHNYGSRNPPLKAFPRLVSHHRRKKYMTHLCQKPTLVNFESAAQ